MTSATEPADDSQLGGRLPLLTPAELDPEQARLRDHLAATRGADARAAGFALELPGGEVIGPFNAFLRVPGIFQALQQWAAAIRHYDLPADVQQVAILTVGAAWHSDYEVYAHTAEARHAGVPDSDVDAIVAGRPPTGLSGPASLAHRLQIPPCGARKHLVRNIQRVIKPCDALRANQFSMARREGTNVVFRRGGPNLFRDINREKIRARDEAVHRLQADVVRVNMIGVSPTSGLHGAVSGGPNSLRLRSNDRMFAIGFVPNRNDFDAKACDELAGVELRCRLAAKAVADAKREFSKDQRFCGHAMKGPQNDGCVKPRLSSLA